MEVYRRLPYHHKLNRSVFTKAVLRLCDRRLASVPDANTGTRVDASAFEQRLCGGWLSVKRRLRRFNRSLVTDGSWPDWQYYVQHSRKLQELWQRPNDEAFDFFGRVLGPDNLRREAAMYSGNDVFLLVSLLTLKLWFEQRR